MSIDELRNRFKDKSVGLKEFIMLFIFVEIVFVVIFYGLINLLMVL